MKRITGIIILLVCLLLPVVGLAEAPALVAPHSVLLEATTGTVLYAHNETERVYPASTTKVLTVFLALEKAQDDAIAAGISLEEQLQQEIEVSSTARDVPPDSSMMGLYVGERLTIYDCMMGTMLISGNEAANVLGEYVSGNLSDFAEKMNQRAHALGAVDTHFVNANGYHDELHYTTAADMAKIMCAAIQNDMFRNIIGTTTYTLRATNMNPERTIQNTNKLIAGNTSYLFSQAIGGKTGYTDIAGNCLLSAAEKDGVTVVSAVFESSIIDGIYTSYTDTLALFGYAFDNFKSVEIATAQDAIAEQPIKRAKGYKNVKLLTETGARLVLPKDAELSECLRRNVIFDNENLKAPLEAEAPLGMMEIYYTGDLYSNTTPVATIRLVADHAYAFSAWSVVRDVLLWIFGILVGILLILFIRVRILNRRRKRYRRR